MLDTQIFSGIQNIFRVGSDCRPAGAEHPDNSCQVCENGDWNSRVEDAIFEEVTAAASLRSVLTLCFIDSG